MAANPVGSMGLLCILSTLTVPLSGCDDPSHGTNHRAVESTAGSPLQVLDLAGASVDPLGSPGARATVFVFTREDCPLSNRYAPEVQRLQAQFGRQGVEFRLVYPHPEATTESIRRHIDEYGYHCDVLRDPQHTLVEWANVRVTPEVAVVVPEGTIVYRGRIDDRWVEFGKARPNPTRRDLEDVLTAIVAGKPLTARTTSAVGCYISDLK